jgi:hypothetical protein
MIPLPGSYLTWLVPDAFPGRVCGSVVRFGVPQVRILRVTARVTVRANGTFDTTWGVRTS